MFESFDVDSSGCQAVIVTNERRLIVVNYTSELNITELWDLSPEVNAILEFEDVKNVEESKNIYLLYKNNNTDGSDPTTSITYICKSGDTN